MSSVSQFVQLHRLSVRYFVVGGTPPDLEKAAPMFHSWIQERKLPGVLIDVADYRHVHQGPGVVLIGHDADWGIDAAAGRIGLLHTQKRWVDGDLPGRVETLLRGAIAAMKLIEADPAFAGACRFDVGRAEIALLDRLRAPNDAAVAESARGAVVAAASVVYGGRAVQAARVEGDARDALKLRVEVAGSPPLAAL